MTSLRAFVLTVGLALICALQFTPGVGVGDSRAADYPASPPAGCTVAPNGSTVDCPTREQAYGWCAWKMGNAMVGHANYTPVCSLNGTSPKYYLCFIDHNGGTSCGGTGSSGYRYNPANECPAGTVWNDASKTCFSSAVCLAKPALGAGKFVGSAASAAGNACSDGCEFGPPSGQAGLAFGNDDGSWTTYTTGYVATGEACGTGDAPPVAFNSTAQDCAPAGAGQTFCVKADGSHCYTVTSTSKQICWHASEVGEKTTDNKVQVRNAGTLPASPQTPVPAGDTLSQVGTPMTKTEKLNGSTFTTTTTNYTSTAATIPGGTESGEPADGTGASSGSGSDNSEVLGKISEGVYGDGSDPNADTTGLDAAAGTAVAGETEYGADGFDQTGFGYGTTCPAPVSVDVMGQTITLDASGVVCQWVTVGGWFVLMIAGIACMRIVVGGGKG